MGLKTVTIMLPCLNEEETLDKCIKAIKKSMKPTKHKWNILVCDNNSTDNSVKIAKKNKVDVVIEKTKGYGATLINGINNAKSDYLVMLDCDMSYNELDIPMMLNHLDDGYDFVIGNRFKGENTRNDAFPFLHKNGTKLLNLVANILFNTKVRDFHCGLRAFRRDKILELGLSSTGMEFASEMVIKAKLHKLKIKQFNTDYKKDERSHKGHLRTFRDGFRHLKLILGLRYNTLGIFKYILVFLFTLLVLVSVLFLSILIKSDNIHKNVYTSLDMYYDNNYEGYIHNVLKNRREYFIDFPTEVKNLSMALLIDENKPIDSLIEMNYYQDPDYGIDDFASIYKNGDGIKKDYSRYWHGQMLYLRPLLSLFTMDTIYIINSCLLLILVVILLKKVFILDKKLFVILLLSMLMVNIFIVPFSTEFFFSIIAMLVFSILMIDRINKDKDVSMLFLIGGMVTCFFDFLTTETLSLSVPLFIYVYLKRDDTTYKEIIKYIIIWGLSYAFMFMCKWALCACYYGFDKIEEILGFAGNRVMTDKKNIFTVILPLFIQAFSYIFPFNFTGYGLPIVLGIILIAVYNFIFNIKYKSDYLPLLLVSLIPIMRFLGVASHSSFHIYFTYRALIPFFMFILLILFDSLFKKQDK